MNDRTTSNWTSAVLRSKLPPTVKHVLLTLGCHMTADGEFHLKSFAKFVDETSLSQDSVLTSLMTAQAAGWIETNGAHDARPKSALIPPSEASE